MTEDNFDYAATYSAMEDDELLELARESATLVDAARAALQKELDTRGLKPEPEPAAEDPDSGFYCPNCERAVPDPLTCGECSTMICRVCGAPLKLPDNLQVEDIESGDPESENLQ